MTDPSLLVLHATGGGTLSGALSALKERGLSYHYLIDKNGDVVKGVPLSAVAYHAGNSYGPREAARGVSRAQGAGANFTARPTPCVNDYSVGISFVNEDDGRHPYPAVQTVSALWLARQIRVMFPDLNRVTTHAIVSPRRKVDPLGYDVDAFARAAGMRVWRP